MKDNLSFDGTSIYMFELLSFPRIIAGGDYFFFRTKKGAVIRGRRLFKILFTRSRALNILNVPFSH